jgi:hypothetical protein
MEKNSKNKSDFVPNYINLGLFGEKLLQQLAGLLNKLKSSLSIQDF